MFSGQPAFVEYTGDIKRMYLSGIESIDAMIPGSLHALLDNISLLCATIGEPATCEGCQNLGS